MHKPYYSKQRLDMVMGYSLFIVLVVMCAHVQANRSPCTPHVNGCTTYIDVPYREHFRPACNKHDVCYSCSSVDGLTRNDCDNRFYHHMMRSCNDSWCKHYAAKYYLVVRIFGSSYYTGSQPYCRYPWVSNCMNR